MDYLVGRVIDNRYEILEQVGTGGMATVYKAKCKVLDRFVAIKILKDSLKNDIDVVKKFNTESRAAARLSHPNIVQVYDVSETGEFDYIVMEYVDGITLKEYILEKGHLDAKEACDFAAQIGRALACAHANGIVHRDIKPHNVLMAADGTVKVADFGIAQATTSETMVAGGGAMGSVHYLSPEQARGGFTNERSDIYSLGVVLYEMLTGKVPFDGANPVAVALAKLEKDPEDIRLKCTHHIPDSVCNIAMKAISKEQHSRYQSASEMVSDLEKVLGMAQIKNSDDGKFETKRLNDAREEYIMRKKTKRRKKNNPAVLVGTIVGVLVLLAGLYLLGMGACSPQKEIEVPDILNMNIDEAEAVLKQHNLKINWENIIYEESDEIEKDRIISQKPKAGEMVKSGRAITVTVSSGPDGEVIEVPDVVDLSVEDAEKRLRNAGFNCVIEEESSNTVDKGKVIRQEPKAEEKLKKGEDVKIYVSGEAVVKVPKLTGMTQAEAVKAINDAGLEVGDVTTGESEDKVGTVIGQHPTPDTEVNSGSRVDIMVSEGSGLKEKTLTISIPDGESESVQVRALADGREFYNKTHKRSEEIVDIRVQSSRNVRVQVFIDDKEVANKVINFD